MDARQHWSLTAAIGKATVLLCIVACAIALFWLAAIGLWVFIFAAAMVAAVALTLKHAAKSIGRFAKRVRR